MHKHITDTDNFFDQTWLVVNTLQMGKGMSFVPASKMVEFYMRMLEDCKLPLATPISNVHYLSQGDVETRDWMYGKVQQNFPNRDAFNTQVWTSDVNSVTCVGPMFFHYFVDWAQGEDCTYEEFCATRQIGDVYLEPSFMTYVAGPQEALALYA